MVVFKGDQNERLKALRKGIQDTTNASSFSVYKIDNTQIRTISVDMRPDEIDPTDINASFQHTMVATEEKLRKIFRLAS